MPHRNTNRIPSAVVLRVANQRNALLRARRVLPALAAVAVLQGCVAVGGTTRADQPTLGKQLIDLKAALDAGAITEPEYQQAKSQLLARS